MSSPLDTFRAEDTLSALHGFQRDAVEYAFDRLYVAPDSTRRFLIADEVGLGKTLIAKGVMAKALEHLRSEVSRIDVVYLCSNLRIARQNINRLNPLKDVTFADAERITLLPANLDRIAENRINFIAFTPGTSLRPQGKHGHPGRENPAVQVVGKALETQERLAAERASGKRPGRGGIQNQGSRFPRQRKSLA